MIINAPHETLRINTSSAERLDISTTFDQNAFPAEGQVAHIIQTLGISEILSVQDPHYRRVLVLTIINNGSSGNLVRVNKFNTFNDIAQSPAVGLLPNEMLQFILQQGWTHYDSNGVVIGTSAGTLAWGSLTGLVSSQTDLQAELDNKENLITPGTLSQYFRGDKTFQNITTVDVTDSLNKRFVTDAELVKLSNTSGVNTGDQFVFDGGPANLANKIIRVRRDIAASWTFFNPILTSGEIALETNTLGIKFGDGVTAYNSLAYFTGSGAVAWGTVTGLLSNQTDLQASLDAITALAIAL